jgi:dTMP kinase
MVAFAAAGAVISPGSSSPDPQRRPVRVRDPGRRGRGRAAVGGLLVEPWLSARSPPSGSSPPASASPAHRAGRHGADPGAALRRPARVRDGARRRGRLHRRLHDPAVARRRPIRGRTFGAFNSGVRTAIFASTDRRAVPGRHLIGREPRELLAGPAPSGSTRTRSAGCGSPSCSRAARGHRGGRHRPVRSSGPWPSHPALDLGRTTPRGAPAPGAVRRLRGRRRGRQVDPDPPAPLGAIERAGHDTWSPASRAARLGEAIRDVLLDPGRGPHDDRAEALLYAAARAQHVDETIRPPLERGAVVLCDRYVDSSVVYQGAARGLGEEHVAELNRWATDGLGPTWWCSSTSTRSRGCVASAGADRLEAAGLPFHRTVAAPTATRPPSTRSATSCWTRPARSRCCTRHPRRRPRTAAPRRPTRPRGSAGRYRRTQGSRRGSLTAEAGKVLPPRGRRRAVGDPGRHPASWSTSPGPRRRGGGHRPIDGTSDRPRA